MGLQTNHVGVSCNMPEELWEKYRVKRFETGRSFQSLVIEAVAKFCDEPAEKWIHTKRKPYQSSQTK